MVTFWNKLFPPDSPEQIVYFHSGICNNIQLNYNTINKEILFIVLYISKLQIDLLKKKFLLYIDCKNTKYVLENDVENIISKHIFARWQVILSVLDFDIEYIKGSQNSTPDFFYLWIPALIMSKNKDNGKKINTPPPIPNIKLINNEPATPLDNC